MRMFRSWSVLVVLIAASGVASAGEEEGSRMLEKGRWSLAFALPEGGGGKLGVWKMVSDRSNVGLNLGVAHSFHERSFGPDTARTEYGGNFWTFSLQPSIKRYLELSRRVSPFLLGALEGSYGWSESGSTRLISRNATLSLGLGADWMPLRDVSIGAFLGIVWLEGIYSQNDLGATKEKVSEFGTRTSELTIHLYF